MAFVLVVAISLVIGLGLYYLPTHDHTRFGAFVLPSAAVSLATAFWVIVTWLGVAQNNGFAWIGMMMLTVGATWGLAAYLSTTRIRADQELLARLSS